MYGGVMADVTTRAVADRPTIVTFHGSDLLGEHLSGRIRQVIAEYRVWASWRAARRASGVITVSKALREALPRDVDRKKVRVLPCGVDLERFKPTDRRACRERLGWDDTKFHVIFPANGGDPVKRFDLAQAAVDAVNRSGVSAELHQLRGIEHSDVPVWLNAADVLLLTSLHEGSPMVIKESLACDLPIVSVPVGDVDERISGVSGCYLASPDPQELAARLRAVHSGSRRVDGRRAVLSLSLQSIAREIHALYADLVKVETSACRSQPI
jgi:glycosyltransferase involved in cell wall biosynthesis